MKSLLIIGALLISSLSWAGSGTSIGNGGVGITANGKLYVLDLFEHSVHDKPVFGYNPLVHWVPDEVETLFLSLSLSKSVQDLFSQKISDIMRKDYAFGRIIMDATLQLDWRLVDSELVRLNDDHSVLEPSGLVQIAVRQKSVVFISLEKWRQLDDANKVALLLHETIYALTSNQSAIDTREVTGFLFTEFFVKSATGFSRQILKGIASLPISKNKPLNKYEEIVFKKGSHQFAMQISWGGVVKYQDSFTIIGLPSADDFCRNPDHPLEVTLSMKAAVYDFSWVDRTMESGQTSSYLSVASTEEAWDGINQTYSLNKDPKTCYGNFMNMTQHFKTLLDSQYVTYP
jgi:hypothetical protein